MLVLEVCALFRRNDDHLQGFLFSDHKTLKPSVKKMLQRSWAPLFYQSVFCNIDEELFAPLYAEMGRPNFPVNRLLALEIIKNIFDYTDSELLDQFHFNYQLMYALGIHNFGEVSLAERTLYEFRERICNYLAEHPDEDDVLFAQFDVLTQNFIKAAGITTHEQRMDSTLISPNIKKAGRLSLAHDVLHHAVKAVPEELLNDVLLQVLVPSFRTKLLYHNRKQELTSRFQSVLDLMGELLNLVSNHPELNRQEPLITLKRFLSEQAVYDISEGRYIARDKKDISASSLQSAYDSDATFRDKGGKKHSGYVLNLSETCAEDNPFQLITDYQLKPNNTSDAELIKSRMDGIKNRTGVEDLYVDGAYYGSEIIEQAEKNRVTLHYTDMTGRKADSSRLPLTQFELDEQMTVKSCPTGKQPVRSDYNAKGKTISAHFLLEDCSQCPLKEQCPVKRQKKDYVLRTSEKSFQASRVRDELNNHKVKCHNISKRAAIEGTNSALKRSQGAGELRTRGITSCGVVMALKVIGHNFTQYWKGMTKQLRRKPKRRRAGDLCLIPG